MVNYPFVEQMDAIDYLVKSIEKANSEFPHDKVFRNVANITQHEPEGGYDMVISFQVFEQLDKPDADFEFSRMACKLGGHIAIVLPNWIGWITSGE